MWLGGGKDLLLFSASGRIFDKREPAGKPMSGGNSNGADRSRSEAD